MFVLLGKMRFIRLVPDRSLLFLGVILHALLFWGGSIAAGAIARPTCRPSAMTADHGESQQGIALRSAETESIPSLDWVDRGVVSNVKAQLDAIAPDLQHGDRKQTLEGAFSSDCHRFAFFSY